MLQGQPRIPVRTRRIILSALLATALLGAAGLGLVQRAGEQVKAKGLSQEEVAQIQKAVSRGRWKVARQCVARRCFKVLIRTWIPEMTLGRVREIGPLSGTRAFGSPGVAAPERAYAFSGGWYSRDGVRWELVRTKDGWKISSFAY